MRYDLSASLFSLRPHSPTLPLSCLLMLRITYWGRERGGGGENKGRREREKGRIRGDREGEEKEMRRAERRQGK